VSDSKQEQTYNSAVLFMFIWFFIYVLPLCLVNKVEYILIHHNTKLSDNQNQQDIIAIMNF